MQCFCSPAALQIRHEKDVETRPTIPAIRNSHPRKIVVRRPATDGTTIAPIPSRHRMIPSARNKRQWSCIDWEKPPDALEPDDGRKLTMAFPFALCETSNTQGGRSLTYSSRPQKRRSRGPLETTRHRPTQPRRLRRLGERGGPTRIDNRKSPFNRLARQRPRRLRRNPPRN